MKLIDKGISPFCENCEAERDTYEDNICVNVGLVEVCSEKYGCLSRLGFVLRTDVCDVCPLFSVMLPGVVTGP